MSYESWDDIFEEAEEKDFIGREKEIANFNQSLNHPRPIPIYYISGQGGVGKTELLKQFQKTAKNLGYIIALSNDEQSDIPTVLGRFAKDLIEAGQKLNDFSERYKVYRRLRQEIETDIEAPQGLAGILANATVRLTFGLLDEVPVARQVTKIVPDTLREDFATKAREYANYLAKKTNNNHDEIALLQNPTAELSPLFFQDLNKIASKHTVILSFDTYEYTRRFLDPWLTKIRQYKPSSNIRMIIAGRTVPGPQWETLIKGTLHIQLDVFSPAEAEAFLNARNIMDAQRRQEILEFSSRLPVLMNWLARPDSTNQERSLPSKNIVERFLYGIEPDLRRVAINIAFPLYFNLDLIALLMEKESVTDVEKEFQWLCQLPPISERKLN